MKDDTKTETIAEVVTPFRQILVTLTFGDLPQMRFLFRRKLNAEEEASKQEFFNLDADTQDQQRIAWRTQHLAKLLEAAPENVPNFPSAEEVGSLEAAFNEFFHDKENEDLLTYIYTIYQNKLYPKELM